VGVVREVVREALIYHNARRGLAIQNGFDVQFRELCSPVRTTCCWLGKMAICQLGECTDHSFDVRMTKVCCWVPIAGCYERVFTLRWVAGSRSSEASVQHLMTILVLLAIINYSFK